MARGPQDYTPKTAPLPHQVEAIRYISERANAALFDEQGLGKTKIVLDALLIAMARKEIDAALIVAPLTLVFVWEQEVRKHTHLYPLVLRGSRKEKKYRFLTGANFYIANYEEIVSELDRIKRFCKSRKTAIILDEAARIKNPTTITAKSLFELSGLAEKRIIVTGTPVANKPRDIWGQFYFLDQGQLLGRDYNEFCSSMNEESPDFEEELSKLQEKVSQNSIRRLKNEVLELPNKSYLSEYVRLAGKQLELYMKVRDELRVEVETVSGEMVVDENQELLKRLLRLIQLASNPALVDKGFKEEPVKFPAVKRLVEGFASAGEKVVVWSAFVDTILGLRNYLSEFSPLLIYGAVPIQDRPAIVQRFQSDEHHKVLIANPSAAKEGLTLTRANNAIYVDRTFSLNDYLQSQDRIHRISQERPCKIIKVIAEETLDEYVDQVIDYKQDVARFIQGDSGGIAEESRAFIFNKKDLLAALGGQP